nr:IS3 family transposase [Actinomadura roseirufa]
MVLDGDRPVSHIARELGIHDTTLHNWVTAWRREHGSAAPGESSRTAGRSDREAELERENRKLREEVAFLKKSRRLLRGRESVTARYELIDAEKANHTVWDMCQWLAVSRSGFYEWRSRPASATAERRELLKAQIIDIFTGHLEAYGYRRVHAELCRRGVRVSPETVRSLMRGLGLVACRPARWRPVTTDADARHRIPDLVRRNFTADAPGTTFVGDVTYIPTWEGFLYLATVIDCCTKKVVGWAMADHFRTPLLEAAMDMAAVNVEITELAIFHSDRGSNYTSEAFGGKLAAMGIRQSVGRTGVCWDNAMAESFFSALKNEWLNRFTFTTRAKARRQVVRYIEGFYNRRRLHSGLGYQTPQEVEDQYLTRKATA